MSPILPQYQRLPNQDEDVIDTWKRPVAMDIEQGDTYPPRHASGSGSGENIVTFIFVPRWPVKGKKESVLGVMGRDKEVCCSFDIWDAQLTCRSLLLSLHPVLFH